MFPRLTLKMRSVLFNQTGPSSVLTLQDTPIPKLNSPSSILIRNHAVGVNFIDTYHRSGLYKVDLPCIPGREAAGIVEEVGSQISQFKKGDRVAYLGMGCYAEYTLQENGALFFLKKLKG